MNANILLRHILGPAVTLCVFRAAAFPIAAPGSEGSIILVSDTGDIIATYEGNSATYSNDLYLSLDGAGNPGVDGDFTNDLFIFNNHLSAVGSQKDLGSFPVGTELTFRLHVNDTGDDFFTGPGTRNPDALGHARVQGDWQPDTTLVSFEDLFNEPEGVNGFNDLSFSFVNTTPAPPLIPEASTVISGLSLAGLFFCCSRCVEGVSSLKLRRASEVG